MVSNLEEFVSHVENYTVSGKYLFNFFFNCIKIVVFHEYLFT